MSRAVNSGDGDRAGQSPQPCVSVIIPSFNHAAFLSDALRSVLAQSFADLEAIVVDDGSTDGTPEVVRRFGESRVRYIHQRNQGLSAARNTGIEASAGRYIALLDADDILEREFLGVMVGLLDGAPEAAAAYCGHQCVDRYNQALPRNVAMVLPQNDFYDKLQCGNFLVPACVMARSESYAAVGPFDSSLRSCEDWDMWLRMARRFAFVGTHRLLVRYRLLSQSMSTVPDRMARYRLAVLEKHFAGAERGGPLHRRATAWAHLRNAVEYVEVSDRASAIRELQLLADREPRLLGSHVVYYELACATQPRGYRGDFRTLDLPAAEDAVMGTLQGLMADRATPPLSRPEQRRALSSAHFALAKLAYGRRDLRAARRHLARSTFARRAMLLEPEFLSVLARSLVRGVLPRAA